MHRLGLLRCISLPAFIIVGYLCISEVITSTLRILLNNDIIVLISAFNIVLTLIILIVTIFIVLIRIQKSQEGGFVVNKRLERMNRHMIAMSILALLAILAFVAITFSAISLSPWGSTIALGIGYILVFSIQVNQIAMFRPHNNPKKKTATTTKPKAERKSSSNGNDGFSSGASGNDPTTSSSRTAQSSTPSPSPRIEAPKPDTQ